MTMQMTRKMLVMACVLFPAWSAVAQDSAIDSQKFDQLSHEVSRMRSDMAIMQKQFYTQMQSADSVKKLPRGDISSQAEARMGALEEQMRGLTGKVEETQHGIAQMQQKLDKVIEDIDLRLKTLEEAKAAAQNGLVQNYTPPKDANAPVDLAAPKKAVGDTQKAAVKPDKEDKKQDGDKVAFKEAKGFLEQARYEKALDAFNDFLKTYKDSDYIPEVHYWSGEVYTIRKQNDKAAIAFLKAYQAKPKGPKAGDSLLRLGGVLGDIGKKSEACTTFKKAAKEFPKDTDLKKQLVDERKRVGC